MKILIFSIAYYPFVGGAEIAIKEIADRLPENEYFLLTNKFDASWPDKEEIDNIEVHRLGNGKKIDKYLFPWRAVSYAIRLDKKINFDFAWSMMAFYAGLAGLFFKYRTKKNYLLTLQSRDSDEFLRRRTWFWAAFYKRIYRKAKVTQSISKFLARRSRKAGNRGEIVLIPNGVDLNVFRRTLLTQDKDNIKRSLNIKNDEKVLITTSRLVLKNGLDDLIKAVNFLLFKIGIKAKLIIFGGGPDEEKLKELASNMGVADHVLFLGYVEHRELVKYVEMADIFIRPSLSEGLGNSFLEAMAVGTPIIGTEVGGIPDFLIDGETGLFCQARNPASIAQAVEKYFKDQNLYNKIVDNGLYLIQEKYSWGRVAAQMKIIFNKMKN